MSTLPENVKIDIVAVNKMWVDLSKVINRYFEGVSKAMREFTNVWFPVISEAHRVESRRIHSLYRRRQKAKKRRNRRR
jgi:exosome complex RNA-binding protein Rrp4